MRYMRFGGHDDEGSDDASAGLPLLLAAWARHAASLRVSVEGETIGRFLGKSYRTRPNFVPSRRSEGARGAGAPRHLAKTGEPASKS